MLPMRPPPLSNAGLIAIAAGMTAVMPLAIDVYLIVMPEIARNLGASLAETQATMATFALGFGIAQLFVGIAADRFGRRPVAIAGTLGFLAASLAVVFAPSLAWLSTGRFLQGLFIATSPILARAIIRDSVPPAKTARIFSLTNGVAGIAPVCAPFIGAIAAYAGGWRAALATLAVYAAGLLVVLALRLPETRPENQPGTTTTPFAAARQIFSDNSFILGVTVSSLVYSALFTWLTTSPFLMMDTLGFSRTAAAFVFGGGSAGYMAGSLIAARLATRFRPEQMILAGAALMLAGGFAGLFALTRAVPHPIIVLVAMLPFYVGIGFAHSNAMQIVMRPFTHIAGQASAWMGVLQQVGGVAISMFAVVIGAGTSAVVVIIACCTALLAAGIVLNRSAP